MASKGSKIGFGYHLTAYLAVNAILVWINLDKYPQYLWAVWPAVGWGIGLMFHGLGIFVFPGSSNKGFFNHLTAFILVNAVLIYLNLTLYPAYLWFKFPLIAWSCMLVFHGWRVFWKFSHKKKDAKKEAAPQA
ncbi:MAG TPA: 2TM domain-containing protein [Spirochaetota bacterium]|nr:2TM domain-containing protein [Spirochaetota bacterium]